MLNGYRRRNGTSRHTWAAEGDALAVAWAGRAFGTRFLAVVVATARHGARERRERFAAVIIATEWHRTGKQRKWLAAIIGTALRHRRATLAPCARLTQPAEAGLLRRGGADNGHSKHNGDCQPQTHAKLLLDGPSYNPGAPLNVMTLSRHELPVGRVVGRRPQRQSRKRRIRLDRQRRLLGDGHDGLSRRSRRFRDDRPRSHADGSGLDLERPRR
jgi:hypothetical protein